MCVYACARVCWNLRMKQRRTRGLSGLMGSRKGSCFDGNGGYYRICGALHRLQQSSSELKKTAILHTTVTREVQPTRHSCPRKIPRGPRIEFGSTDTWQLCSYVSSIESKNICGNDLKKKIIWVRKKLRNVCKGKTSQAVRYISFKIIIQNNHSIIIIISLTVYFLLLSSLGFSPYFCLLKTFSELIITTGSYFFYWWSASSCSKKHDLLEISLKQCGDPLLILEFHPELSLLSRKPNLIGLVTGGPL